MKRVRIKSGFTLAAVCLMIIPLIAGLFSIGAGSPPMDGLVRNEVEKTRADVDLGIVNVSFLSAYGPPFYPGMMVTINVTVRNFAIEPAYAYDVICAVNDQFSNSTVMAKNATTLLAPYQNGIDNYTFQFQWASPVVPPVEYSFPHIFKVVCTISIASDENASNNQVNKDLLIDKADFQPKLELGVYSNTTHSVDPSGYDPVVAEVGGTVQVPFTLFNNGPGQDLIQIGIIAKPINWTVGSFSPTELAEGVNTTDDLQTLVQVSSWKHDAMEGVDYVVTLKAYSLNYPLAYDTMDIHFSINFEAGISLHSEETDIQAFPGESVMFEVNLTNTGNGKDSFYSSLAPLDNVSTQAEWKAYIDSGTLTPAISRGVTYLVRIRVKVGPDAIFGSSCNVTLTTRSNKAGGTENPLEVNLTLSVHAGRVHYPVLETLETNYTIDPSNGTSEKFFNLTNMGNARDDTIWLNVSRHPPGWIVNLNTSAIPGNGLAYQATAVIGLTIKVPKYDTPGTGYEIEIEAWAGESPKVYDTMILSIEILTAHNFSVEVEEDIRYVEAGDELVYSAVIRNLGNEVEVFEVDVHFLELEEYPGLNITVEPKTITIPANEVRRVNITIGVPEDATADTNLATASVYEGYYLELIVEPESDPERSISKQLIFKVNPKYDFWMTLDNAVVNISGDRDDVLPFAINLTNLGNIKSIVDLEVISDYKWFTLVTIHKYIPFGESREAVIQVEPHKGLEPGTYMFAIKGTCREDRNITRSVFIEIRVGSYNFKIENVRVFYYDSDFGKQAEVHPEDGEYLMGVKDTLLITAQVSNSGSDYTADLYGDIVVSFYEGRIPITAYRTNISSLGSGDSMEVSLQYSSVLAEPKVIRIVIDSADHIPESNEEDNSAELTVSVIPGSAAEEEEDHPNRTVWEALGGIGVFLILLLVVIVIATVVFLVVFIRRKSREDELQRMEEEEGRVRSQELYGAPELEPPVTDAEQLDHVSEDPQETLEEDFFDPNIQPVFDNDPEGVLAEISDQVSGDEKPSDFETADEELEAKLAEKRDKGEITEEFYLQQLLELKDD